MSSVISVRNVDHTFKEILRRRYTFTPRIPPGTPRHVRPVSISLYSTYKDFFNVPRELSVLETFSGKIHDAQDNPVSSRVPNFRASLDPSRNQPEAVQKCVEELRKHPWGGGCLLSLPPGFGKTACALFISSKIATRTLILVHTSVLAQQWKQRVEQFLENACVKIVTCTLVATDLKDATHIIVLLQTVVALKKRNELAWLQNLHDFIIVDEVHHVCARTLCQVVETVGCRYRLGLSATIQRKDGLDTMLTCLFGPLAYQCERHDHPNLTVHAVQYVGPPTTLEPGTFVDCLAAIAQDEERQDFISKIVHKLHADGRYVLVLSDRLQQLGQFQSFLVEKGIHVYMAVGGSKGEPDMDKRPVVLASYPYASEGLDLPLLNTCVLATPRVDVKQSVGRILRSSTGSHAPLVVDIVDLAIPMLQRQFGKRKRFYTNALKNGGLDAKVFLTYQESAHGSRAPPPIYADNAGRCLSRP